MAPRYTRLKSMHRMKFRVEASLDRALVDGDAT